MQHSHEKAHRDHRRVVFEREARDIEGIDEMIESIFGKDLNKAKRD